MNQGSFEKFVREVKNTVGNHNIVRSFMYSKMRSAWSCRSILQSRYSSLLCAVLIVFGACTKSLIATSTDQETFQSENVNNLNKINEDSSKTLPANHRMDPEVEEKVAVKTKPSSGRQSRQYDGPMSASSSGNYAAISGDGGAYVAQVPLTGTNYGPGSSPANSYANELSGSAYHPNVYHDPMSLARGYSAQMSPLHHPSVAGYSPAPLGGPISSIFSAGPFGGGGLLSSSMFPLMSKGFDVSEIVCTAVAVAIGAVIIGAPFILIYLFVMNQMNNSGPNGGPSGGAISLTGPTSSTTVSGRKKRQTSLPEALFKQLSPLVNNEQVASTFKALMSSIAKYQM